MRLNPVPASTGLTWVKLGMETFRRQPLAITGLFFMFMGLMMALGMLPVVGQFIGLVTIPALQVGLLSAAREAHAGRFPRPRTLLVVLQNYPERRMSMLHLGLAYASAMLAVQLLTVAMVGELPVATDPNMPLTADQLLTVWRATLSMALGSIIVGVLFWHAPALVHWHGISPGKSVFFSLMACWTNRGAMVVYGLACGAMLGGGALILSMLAAIFGPMMMWLVPVGGLVLSSILAASVYFTYRDSFVDDSAMPPNDVAASSIQ